jgi:hypothetical protein
MHAYQKAVSLGITGDDKTMFETLQQYGLTHYPIKLGDLLFMLSDRNMMVRLIRPADTGEKWAGTLVNLILFVNQNGTPEQVVAVNKFFSHITNDRNIQFDTTNPAYAGAVWAMRQAFQDQPGMPSSADFDALADLGGGAIATTLEDFSIQRKQTEDLAAQQKAVNDQQSLMATVLNEYINPAQSKTALIDGLKNAIAYLESL